MKNTQVTARLEIDNNTLQITADKHAQEYFYGQTIFTRADWLLIREDFEQGIGLLYQANSLNAESIEALLRGLLYQETT